MKQESFQTEDDLTAWLETMAPAIGDDAALIGPIGDHAITVDSQREGVHFLAGTPAGVIARRLLAVNLSDLAAVGARPRRVLCTLAAPREFPRRRFFEALLTACSQFEVELVGGDLATSNAVETTLTAIGTRHRRGRFLTRSCATDGDGLWIAGNLGWSRAGLELLQRGAHVEVGDHDSWTITLPSSVPEELIAVANTCIRRHLEPRPQLHVSRYLATRKQPIAAIDVSDGLAKDLGRLARSSEVGVRLEVDALGPGSTDFNELCAHLEVAPTACRIGGGEDYALLFTAPQKQAVWLRKTFRRDQARQIGSLTPAKSGITVVAGGNEFSLQDYLADQNIEPGYDHLAG